MVAQKGTCKLSKMNTCKIFTTKYNLAVAPNVLDKIKKEAPVWGKEMFSDEDGIWKVNT